MNLDMMPKNEKLFQRDLRGRPFLNLPRLSGDRVSLVDARFCVFSLFGYAYLGRKLLTYPALADG
jgi:hypothetical protein